MSDEQKQLGAGSEVEFPLHDGSLPSASMSAVSSGCAPGFDEIVPISGNQPFLNALGIDRNGSREIRAGIVCVYLGLGRTKLSGGSGIVEAVGYFYVRRCLGSGTSLEGMVRREAADQAPLVGQVTLDAPDRAVRERGVVDKQFGQVSVCAATSYISVVREIVGLCVARGPESQDGQAGRPGVVNPVSRTILPQRAGLDGTMGMNAVKKIVRSTAVEMEAVVLPKEGPVPAGIFDDPKYGTDVIDVVKAVIVTIGPGVSHDGQPVLGIGNDGWRTVSGGMVAGA